MTQNLNLLRKNLKSLGLHGFIVPHSDEYQNEYLPACAERLAWLTGFTGSAGYAIVLADQAAFFTDGRYTVQAKQQVDAKSFALLNSVATTPPEWLAGNAGAGQKIGYDPWLHTPQELNRYRVVLMPKNIMLVPVDQNPIDALWTNRPPAPQGLVSIYDAKYAGQSSAQKRAMIATQLQKHGISAAVITQPDSIAWLLNIRGSDVEFNPLPLCMAVMHADEQLDLYIDGKKIDLDVKKHLGAMVNIFPPSALLPDLQKMNGKSVAIDPVTCASKIADTLQTAGAKIVHGDDPCQLPKALKNKTEQTGMRNAHKRDGLAMVRFLHWLSGQNVTQHDEITVAEKLQSFRAEDKNYRGDSFATIAGFGKNGAIVHYRANAKTKSKLSKNNILLLDSGAQYADGTTDITRTIALGKVTAEQRSNFTRVLQGHIALASAQFPIGTTGSQLDSLARQFLWQAGLDYDHGTGHGVGCYLCVHEGPQRISKIPNRVALQPGMVISNEPGYYKTGAYGIRIENLIMVQPAKGKKGFLCFETLTLVPIDRKLIDVKMLSAQQKQWINDYHARVYRELHARLDKKASARLKQATAPIK